MPKVPLKSLYPWLGKIPQGSHGSGSIQKKYWKVTSDLVRIRDFHEWKGLCISCTRRSQSWGEFQAGHCKAWGACRGYSKWDTLNIFGQCPFCNQNGDVLTGKYFLETVRIRYGQERIEHIEKLASYPTEKMDDYHIAGLIKSRLLEMKELPEQPDYYSKVEALL